MRIRKRYHLKKKKLKDIIGMLGGYATLIPEKATVEIIETEKDEIILVNGEPLIMLVEGTPFPTLKGALKIDMKSNYAVVDMGAVRYLANGADVMSPGIIEADPQIKKGDAVVVIDEKNRKPLAVGISLIKGPEMVENKSGKAIKTLHYIGDRIWNLEV